MLGDPVRPCSYFRELAFQPIDFGEGVTQFDLGWVLSVDRGLDLADGIRKSPSAGPHTKGVT
jgi:hypothetical protein